MARRRRRERKPLNKQDARDWAVRDYRAHLQDVLKRKPATVNNALAAVDDLYIRRGLGPANAARAELHWTAPKALDSRAAIRFLREVQKCPSPRDAPSRSSRFTLAPGSPRSSACTSTTRDCRRARASCASRKGEKVREIPIHPDLRAALSACIDERGDWPGADTPRPVSQPARRPPLRQRRAPHLTTVATAAGLKDDQMTAHALRHTFATRLVRGRTDLVIVAELPVTPAWRPCAPTAGPPSKTRSTRSNSSTSTTEPAGAPHPATLYVARDDPGPQRGLQAASPAPRAIGRFRRILAVPLK